MKSMNAFRGGMSFLLELAATVRYGSNPMRLSIGTGARDAHGHPDGKVHLVIIKRIGSSHMQATFRLVNDLND